MEKFEEQPSKRTRPQIIEEPIENTNSEESVAPEEQFLEKSRAQIAEEELEEMKHDREEAEEKIRHDKSLEEAEEEFKEQSSDYKVDYNQYLKGKEESIKESKTIETSSPERKVITKEEPVEIKEEKVESKKEEVEEKPVEQTGKEVKEQLEEVLKNPEKPEIKEESKDNSKEVEIGILANELIGLFDDKNELLVKKNEQQGLMYRLGIKKQDSKINDEYIDKFDKYNEVLKKLENLTGYSAKEIEDHYFGERESEEKQEKSPETERKVEGLKDYLYKKAKEVNEQIKNLEGGKKGSFEKIKALMKDRKFQFIVGLAIVGVAIAAPPTGFVSMITFGMHAGFLPAAYATKATALAGIAGGAFIMRGFSGFVNDLKKEGKDEIDLTNEIK
ncbi:MAG: hypothetical protein WAW15_01050 [Minisyncoccales bacterium]